MVLAATLCLHLPLPEDVGDECCVRDLLQQAAAGLLDTPVDDPEVQALVADWDALAARFHGGDERIKETANRLWEENRQALDQQLGWSTDQATNLVAYLRRVREASS